MVLEVDDVTGEGSVGSVQEGQGIQASCNLHSSAFGRHYTIPLGCSAISAVAAEVSIESQVGGATSVCHCFAPLAITPRTPILEANRCFRSA